MVKRSCLEKERGIFSFSSKFELHSPGTESLLSDRQLSNRRMCDCHYPELVLIPTIAQVSTVTPNIYSFPDHGWGSLYLYELVRESTVGVSRSFSKILFTKRSTGINGQKNDDWNKDVVPHVTNRLSRPQNQIRRKPVGWLDG